MKREFLKNLGLSDEQVDKVMKENGRDIEAKNAELKSLEEKLSAAGKKIGEYEKIDVEGLKKRAEDLEKSAQKYKGDYESLKKETGLMDALRT